MTADQKNKNPSACPPKRQRRRAEMTPVHVVAVKNINIAMVNRRENLYEKN